MTTAPQLCSALAEDLEGTFEELVASFQHGLYAFVMSLCHDSAHAEEVVQDSFVRAFRALAGYEPERIRELALRPWLYRITLNVYRNSLRRRPALPLAQAGPDAADPGVGPEAEVVRSWEWRRLLLTLSRLPEPYRLAVTLKYVRDLSYAEIGSVLDQPVGTVKSNVHRGVAMLRSEFLSEVS